MSIDFSFWAFSISPFHGNQMDPVLRIFSRLFFDYILKLAIGATNDSPKEEKRS